MSQEIKQYTYKSGAVYEGTFDGDKRSGKGHWQHPQGETYEGEYANNKQEGLGVYIFPDSGKCYMGNWAHGKMNGLGVYFYNRDRNCYYHGTYKDDKKDGAGVYLYDTGIMTTQTWSSGRMTKEDEASPVKIVEKAVTMKELMDAVHDVAQRELGEVPPPSEVRSFQFGSGATYTGQYYGTKKHGKGYWLHPEGDSYEGQFENNRHNGWGVYIIGRSGKRYVGQWRDGKMNGIGVYFFNPQETEYFIGTYRDDKKHGRGLYHFADTGNSKVQTWDDGVLKQETNADESTDREYVAAIKKIIEVVKPFAPNYDSIAFLAS